MSKTKKTTTKRAHTGKLGKKQEEFIYNLRSKHTSKIISEFKKTYGYLITAGRVKSAIKNCEVRQKVNTIVERALNATQSDYSVTNESVTFFTNNKQYTIPLQLFTADAILDIRNQRVQLLQNEINKMTT